MSGEYLKPMLDPGSPRVLNCNIMTRRIQAEDPTAQTFFRCKPLNDIVLIKDSDPSAPHGATAIGTKIYLPFNENDIYDGGRTIFVHAKNVEGALTDIFGAGALPPVSLAEDMRIMRILNNLPSLDPFLLKDMFINEHIEMNPAYFEVDKALWNEIELFILEGFEPLAKAAFPDALSSDGMARKLITKIWEGSDMEALKPLIMAFRLPAGHEREIFAAWKGIIFYGFQQRRMEESMARMVTWLKEVKIPLGALSSEDRNELKATLETVKANMQAEWRATSVVLQEYQVSYDKMFKHKTGSADFVAFLQNSSKAYWTLGNSLGKVGQALYCWETTSKRYPERKLPWEKLYELIILFDKIFTSDKKLPGPR